MRELSGKVAAITGGGSGFGRALAQCCARRGMKLVLADVDEPGLAETVSLVEARFPGTESVTRRTDVSNLAEMEALAALSREHFGGAHLVFNNAGVSCGGPVWELTPSDWQWVLGVNLYGVVWGIKAFVPMMLEQGEGHVVNTASAAGWMSPPGGAIYNASKCAVVSLSETLAADLKEADASLGVTVVSPAFFPTNITESERNRPAALGDTAPMTAARRERSERVKAAVAKGRLSADEIAEQTLQAVEANQFYVFPHQRIKDSIRARAEAACDETAAFDPFAR